MTDRPTPHPALRPNSYVIFVDGSAESGRDKPTGVGIRVMLDGTIVGDHGYPAGPGTNITAEIDAAIVGLSILPHASDVEVFTDSEHVVKTMRGLYNKGANRDRWARLEDVAAKMERVTWTFVKGHNNHPDNMAVDRLAKAARKQGITTADFPQPWTPTRTAPRPVREETDADLAADRRLQEMRRPNAIAAPVEALPHATPALPRMSSTTPAPVQAGPAGPPPTRAPARSASPPLRETPLEAAARAPNIVPFPTVAAGSPCETACVMIAAIRITADSPPDLILATKLAREAVAMAVSSRKPSPSIITSDTA